MAGDHKCPVCSSTFTRPQHVARHMRSHTGDRPYKCVHCGDQFARSDLLSRHVNKCHASEKPPTTTQPARRKGHAQPGSSSAGGVRGPAPPLIPPPGSRKICDSCAHSRTPAQCDSGLPCGKCLQRNTKCTYVKANEMRRPANAVPRQHDLLANPVPLTVPSMAAPPQFPSQPAFNFTVPLYPQSLDPRAGAGGTTPAFRPGPPFADSSPHPPPLSLSASTSESVESPLASYDAAFMLSQCMQPQPHPPAYTNGAHAHATMPPYPGDRKLDPPFLPQQFLDLPDLLYQPPPQHQQQQQTQQQQYSFDPADLYFPDPHRASDFAHFQQQPGQTQQQQAAQGPAFPAHDDFPALHEGGFSSAFGLMSLDDPAVAAEMSKGASFFAPGAAALRTGAKPETPGRDANIAELRDFWKAFMRNDTPGAERPPPARRVLSKMASLPDIKTPPVVDAAPPGSSTAEDLASYEQAVLARKAPRLSLARPTFKRLASQTLGPFESKSARVEHAEAVAAYEGAGAGRGSPEHGGGGAQQQQQQQGARRLSAPTAGRPHFGGPGE